MSECCVAGWSTRLSITTVVVMLVAAHQHIPGSQPKEVQVALGMG